MPSSPALRQRSCVEVFRALSYTKALTVPSICAKVPIHESTVRAHLRILERHGFVERCVLRDSKNFGRPADCWRPTVTMVEMVDRRWAILQIENSAQAPDLKVTE
jgi:predicted ArsR family transcriptional regulator